MDVIESAGVASCSGGAVLVAPIADTTQLFTADRGNFADGRRGTGQAWSGGAGAVLFT